MTKVRFDAFHDLRSLQNEVNRLFSSNMSDAFADEGIARGTWNPPVDIYENKDRIVIEADLPGMNREDIHLTFGNNVLNLSGERRFEKKDEADNYAWSALTAHLHAPSRCSKQIQSREL